MNIGDKMKRDWDQRAQHHARFWIATEQYQTEEIFAKSGEVTAQALLQTVATVSKPSWKVLDIGCGIGRLLKPLSKYFQTLVGIDVSSTMIAKSKEWLFDCPQISTMETSGVDLREFKDQSFDLVYSYVTFQHMPRPVFEQYLGEINRILSPDGYLAMQLPIGQLWDVPLEDTIGIRSYPLQEIEEKLLTHGLAFCQKANHPSPATLFDQPIDHRFHLIKKMKSMKPEISVNWMQLEHPLQVSPLDMHLYETYADNCAKMGNPQEGIQTLQALVHRNPQHLSGWLRLTALLIENQQIPQALHTLQELTNLHPRYQEGQILLERLRKKWVSLKGESHSKGEKPHSKQPDQLHSYIS